MPEISKEERSALQEALINGFDIDELRIMVRNDIQDDWFSSLPWEKGLNTVVFELVELANRCGEFEVLLEAACKKRPNNPKLSALGKKHSISLALSNDSPKTSDNQDDSCTADSDDVPALEPKISKGTATESNDEKTSQSSREWVSDQSRRVWFNASVAVVVIVSAITLGWLNNWLPAIFGGPEKTIADKSENMSKDAGKKVDSDKKVGGKSGESTADSGDQDSKTKSEVAPPVLSVEEKVIAIVATRFGVDKENVTDKTFFLNDLGADDLDRVELVMDLEEEFDVSISDDAWTWQKFPTVGRVIEYIKGERSITNLEVRKLLQAARIAKDAQDKSLYYVNAMRLYEKPLPEAQLGLQKSLSELPLLQIDPLIDPVFAFSLDGSSFAAGSGAEVYVFDLMTGKHTRFFKKDPGGGGSIALRHDAKYVASTCGQNVLVWDCSQVKNNETAKQEPYMEITDARFEVQKRRLTIAFDSEGSLLILKKDGSLKKVNLKTKQSEDLLKDQRAIGLSPNGAYVVVRSENKSKSLSIVEPNGKKVSDIQFDGYCNHVRFSESGDYLIGEIAGSKQGELGVWKRNNGRFERLQTSFGKEVVANQEKRISTINIAPGGNHIAFVQGPEEEGVVTRVGSKHGTIKWNSINRIGFSPNGKLVAYADRSHQLRIESLLSPPQESAFWHDDTHSRIGINPSSKLTCMGNKRVTSWDLEQQTLISSRVFQGKGLALSTDGERIAMVTDNNVLKVEKSHDAINLGSYANQNPVSCAAFSRSGEIIAFLSFKRTVESFKHPRSTKKKQTKFSEIKIKVVNLSAKSVPREFTYPENMAANINTEQVDLAGFEIAVNDLGTHVFVKAGDSAKEVVFSDSEAQPKSSQFPIAFPNENQALIPVFNDNENCLVLRNLGSKTQDIKVCCAESRIRVGAYGEKNFYYAGALEDGSLRVWRTGAEENREIARLHDPSAVSIAFSPRNEFLVVAGEIGVRVWRWRPENLVKEAELRLPTLELSKNELQSRIYNDADDVKNSQ